MNVGEPPAPSDGNGDQIPIRNLWLLMLYASRLLRELDAAKRNVEENPDDIPNLVAELLARRVERRLRRNLSLTYIEKCATLSRVRGRVDQLKTERHRLLQRGKIACRFQKLDVDTVANRYVRAALVKSAVLVQGSDRELAHSCRALAGVMQRIGVVGELPSRSEMGAYQSTYSDRHDREMLTVAKLIFDLALPNELSGQVSLSELDRGRYLRGLFEAAVGGFYDVVLKPKGWRISTSKKLGWQVSATSVGMSSILPGMETDVTLESPLGNERIIIDTKFTAVLTRGQFGNDSLKSGYLYQIYAYLRSQEGRDELSDRAYGLLLHPAVGETLDEWALIQGHMIRFATVDLAAPATSIRSELLDRIDFTSLH